METKTKIQETKVSTKINNKEDSGKIIAKVAGKYEVRNSDKGLLIYVKKDLKVRVRLMKIKKQA